jgi:hypothetical protein
MDEETDMTQTARESTRGYCPSFDSPDDPTVELSPDSDERETLLILARTCVFDSSFRPGAGINDG